MSETKKNNIEQEVPEQLGESYWSIVGRQLRANHIAMAGLYMILLVTTIAVFVPLLSSDKPFYFKAKIKGALLNQYDSAYFTLLDAIEQLDGMEKSKTNDPKLRAQYQYALTGLDRMSSFLHEEQAKPLKELHAKIEQLAQKGKAGEDWNSVKELTAAIEEKYDGEVFMLPDKPMYPALRLLKTFEIFFIVAWVMCLPAWLLRKKYRWVHLSIWLVLIPATLAAVLWRVNFPPIVDINNYKQLVRDANTTDEISDLKAIFPLCPFGENQNITAEARQKPSWLPYHGVVQFKNIDNERLPEYRKKLRNNLKGIVQPDGTNANQNNLVVGPFRHRSAAENYIEQLGDPAIAKADIVAIRLKDFQENYHWFGTDTNGRDVLCRMIFGARISTSIGFVAVSIYLVIGVVLGALAGYYRGWVDIFLSRLIELVICFPVFFLILIVLFFFKPSIFNIMIVLGLTGWTGVARLQRGEFLKLVNQDFVSAIRALGGSDFRIIFRHILPNGLGPIMVVASFGIASAILTESALSFLGFGVPQPAASWGDILNNGRNDIQGNWWLTVFPGIAIFITVTAYNLFGEGLRDAIDPRLKK